MKRISLLILLAATLVLGACSKLTEDNLQKIQNGMTTEQVKTILGTPTDVQTSGAFGFSGTTYLYHTEASDVKISFLNDKVIAKEGEFK
jgi:outer membrane protein assembly factor BamE (lipoprotein component of BamABCDE complex)